MITYYLTLSQVFPSTHARAGEPTNFEAAFRAGQVFNRGSECLYRHPKLHTIRANYEFWAKRFEKIEAGEACLSIRQWVGKPYGKGSTQREIARLTREDGIGLQKMTVAGTCIGYHPTFVDGVSVPSKTLADIRRDNGFGMPYLRPDAKSQVTMELDEAGNPKRVDTIVLSTQHDEFASDKAMQERISYDVVNILMPLVKSRIRDEKVLRLLGDDIKYYVNPTGKFVIGGPAGDTGLTGRKIICDTYGGYGAHGGGAFSGKDPSKVDRSAAYAARWIAKNMVATGFADKMLIQLAYAIGVPEPVSIHVNTYGTAHNITDERIEDFIRRHFDLTPEGIERELHLKAPIYEPTAAYGHFGRKPFASERSDKFEELMFFPWECIVSERLYK